MMPFANNPLESLARRVRLGEPGAAEEFKSEMERALEGMVRLALRKRACFNPFEACARAEADRLQENRVVPLHDAELARQTAGRLCQDMIGRLQAGGRPQDTVACVPLGRRSPMCQTVLAAC
jgi:hypothetical protein